MYIMRISAITAERATHTRDAMGQDIAMSHDGNALWNEAEFPHEPEVGDDDQRTPAARGCIGRERKQRPQGAAVS